MKNDFRDYISHSFSDHKYIRKEKTSSGIWRYIYPDNLKKKISNIKRDVNYTVRNFKSKITGKNETFKRTSLDRYADANGELHGSGKYAVDKPVNYEKIQREARAKGATAQKKKDTLKKFNDMDVASSKKVARSKIHNQKAIKASNGKDYWFVKEKKENVIPGTPGWRVTKDSNKPKTKKKKTKKVNNNSTYSRGKGRRG